MTKHALPLLAGLIAACLAAPASAGYSQIIAFGDSLSDNGNLLALTGQPPAPYFNGRFSNGPVAVEVMAQTLGLSLTDFAYGGAQTGTGNLLSPALNGTGVAGQVAKYGALTGGHADSSALYLVWAGANDFFAGSNIFNPAVATTASNNLLNDIQTLYSLGAREFFVPLMPNLGVTPSSTAAEASVPGYKATASAQTTAYNTLVLNGLNGLSSSLSGIQIKTFDTTGFMATQMALMASEGKDVTHSCFVSSVPSLCANPDDYLFWDGVHPTGASHRILGQAFAAAVPEPQTWVLMVAGLALTAWASRRQTKASAPAQSA